MNIFTDRNYISVTSGEGKLKIKFQVAVDCVPGACGMRVVSCPKLNYMKGFGEVSREDAERAFGSLDALYLAVWRGLEEWSEEWTQGARCFLMTDSDDYDVESGDGMGSPPEYVSISAIAGALKATRAYSFESAATDNDIDVFFLEVF